MIRKQNIGTALLLLLTFLLGVRVFSSSTSFASEDGISALEETGVADRALSMPPVAASACPTAVLETLQAAHPSESDTSILFSCYMLEDRGLRMISEDVSLYAEARTVKKPVEIRVSRVAFRHGGALPAMLRSVTAGGGVIRLQPRAQRFDKAVTLVLHYDPSLLPHGCRPDDIQIYRYDSVSRHWQRLSCDSVDTVRHTVHTRTDRLGDYVAGVLSEPEGDDAVAFAPTTLPDIDPAHPLDGITVMAPPEAVNSGAATLEYPLALPAGRRGMTPRLVARYSSDGGGGILGQGWSLPMSEISVDTRWGVPRYLADVESEDYLLDGAPLTTAYEDGQGLLRLRTPVHRRAYEPRQSGDVRYYLRVEGAFRRIVRHGGGPGDYWWEVTDKDGTRHIYGQSAQARLTCGRRTARWLLERSVDPWGNTVDYRYRTRCTPGGAEGAGRQVLLEEIRYSGNTHTGEPGPYRVRLRYAAKTDAGLGFRYGFQEDDGVVLDRVEVRLDTLTVRDYWFGYRHSALGRTLLCCVVEAFDDSARYQRYRESPIGNILLVTPYERCGLELKSEAIYPHHIHTFDYYDIGGGGEWFGAEETMDEEIPSDNIFDALGHTLIVDGQIGGNASGGWSVSGGANVGTNYNCDRKNMSAIGRYSYSSDENVGIVTLADLDGDGLPDKLYRKLDGTLKCCRQIAGANAFDSPVTVSGADAFLRTENSSDSWGVEMNVTGPVGAGATWNDGRSTTYTYLLDVNGDGLTDIVDDGRVLLNRGGLRFDDVTHNDTLHTGGGCADDTMDFRGTVSPLLFSDGLYTVDREVCNSELREMPVYDTLTSVSGCDSVVFRGIDLVLVSEECHTVTDTFRYTFPRRYEPDIDLVRMWVAPYSGTVTVSGTARMSDSLAALRAATGLTDGVWLSVHRAGDTVPRASAVVTPDSARQLSGIVPVTAGDTLFFRIHAMGRRQFCEVEWIPRVRYLNAVLRDGTVVSDSAALCATDINGDSVYCFNYATDFLLSGEEGVSVSDTTTNTILNDYAVRRSVHTAQRMSQPLVSSVVLTNPAGGELTLLSDTLTATSLLDTVILVDTLRNVNGRYLLHTRLGAAFGGQERWSAVEADVEVTLIASSSAVLTAMLQDTAARHTFVYHPAVEYRHYDCLSLPGEAVPVMPGTLSFPVTVTTCDTTAYSGTLPVILRNAADQFCYLGFVVISGGTGTLNIPASQFPPHATPTYRFDFHTDDSAAARRITGIRVSGYRAGLYVRHGGGKHHGTLYRGWGQFGYKDGDSVARCIRSALIRPDSVYSGVAPVVNSALVNSLYSAAHAANGPEDLPPAYHNPLSGSFFEMRADARRRRWTGYGDAILTTRWLCSLDGRDARADQGGGRSVVHAASPMPVVSPGTPAKAVNRQTYDASTGATVILFTMGSGHVRHLSDCLDLNGDGYPDMISEARIQYSKSQGGLGAPVTGYVGGIGRSTHNTNGFSCNGTYPGAGHDHNGDPHQSRIEATEGAGGPFGVSGDYCHSADVTGHTLLDANGDGLPDIVYVDGGVRYNRGYDFTALRPARCATQRRSSSDAVHTGVSFNIGSSSITGGLGGSVSSNTSELVAVDLDGDGIPDQADNNHIVIYAGDGIHRDFSSAGMDGSTTLSLGIHASVTVDAPIPIPLVPLKAGVSFGGGVTAALTHSTAEFVDIDGDGLSDYVYRDHGDIKVRRCRAAKSGLLRSVVTPSQARYLIDYSRSTPTVAAPGSRWQMSELKICSAFPQGGRGDTLYLRYSYSGRRYDRFEREDCGVAESSTREYASRQDWLSDHPARVTTRRWHNDHWRLRGLPVEEMVLDPDSGAWSAIRRTWRDADLRDGHWHSDSVAAWCRGDAWPALASEETVTHEADGGTVVSQRLLSYGPWGNVIHIHDRGDTNDAYDDCHITLEYNDADVANHIVGNVTAQTVTDAAGDTLRHRKAAYNTEGALDSLTVALDDFGAEAVWRMHYDFYGNTDLIFTPQTDTAGHRYWIFYKYDDRLHALPVKTENAEGYESHAVYDMRWQRPLLVVGIGGDTLRYSYDSHGNLDSVTAPAEAHAGTYTLRHDYWYRHRQPWDILKYPDAAPVGPTGLLHRLLWSRASQYDVQRPGDDIVTTELCDGLGRTIQRKRETEVDGTLSHIVEGATRFDAMGRTVRHHLAIAEDDTTDMTCYNTHALDSPSDSMSFDGLGRVVRTCYADGSTGRVAYGTDLDSAGCRRLMSVATDCDGATTLQLSDHRGLVIQSVDAEGGLTRLCHDAMGRLAVVVDAEGHVIRHYYDLGGRRVMRRHPSTGVTRWSYDVAGNITQVSLNSGGKIDYSYNYGRLFCVKYGHSYWNDVCYEYGAPGRGGASGRVVRRQDASGVTRYAYDAMGNVVRERRTCVLPDDSQPVTLVSEWNYDSWGRVQRIVYPDSEVVDYLYDRGGNLFSVTGQKPGRQAAHYIRQIHYNRFGQRVMELDGDSVESRWDYNPLNLRLTQARALSLRTMRLLADIRYSYSPQGDILTLDDNGDTRRWQTFRYDSRHWLAQSEGEWKGFLTYTANYKYMPTGRMERKDVQSLRMDHLHGQYALDYDYCYHYPSASGANVFAADTVRDMRTQSNHFLWWDADGNLSREYYRYRPLMEQDEKMERRLCHNEEGQMQGYWQCHDGEVVSAWYAYDGEGRRTLKLASPLRAGDVRSVVTLSDPVVYPSPLVTLTGKGYSKHYFEGTRRVCTALGGGFSHVAWDSVAADTVPRVGWDAELLTKVLWRGVEYTYKCLGIGWKLTEDNSVSQMLYEQTHKQHDDPEPAFYYYTDHLGSTALLIDDSGRVVQKLAYMPYGEDWVDDSRISYSDTTRIGVYQFNGKERDYESGFLYYGARYYCPELWTGWTTPDPMMDRYPGISPYAYCNWNPVNLVDPDGRNGKKIIDVYNKTITVTATYYVTSIPQLGLPNTYYTEEEIESMQFSINKVLNDQHYIYEYNGEIYNVAFDLRFIAAGENCLAQDNANSDPLGNHFSKSYEGGDTRLGPKEDSNGTITHIGGYTVDNKKIVMNAKYDNERRRIHEIFHTLFYNNDNAPNGIGNYNPGTDLPNQSDIDKLLNNTRLQQEFK